MRNASCSKHKENNAYLDIETTGLSPSSSYITVIGICLEKHGRTKFYQLVDPLITSSELLKILKDVQTLYTYNGSRFDLMYINSKLGVDLNKHCTHRDLMYDCWRNDLYGGLKKVERQLGIRRELKDVDGRMAVVLWKKYKERGDRQSLKKLLEYNKEDVLNLIILRNRIHMR